MNDNEQPGEQVPHPRNEAEEVRYVFDDLLDELSALGTSESSPDDPDFMARKAAVKRELDMYSLDHESRIKKIFKMKNEASAAYQQAEDAFNLKPKDLLLKVRLATATETLRRAIFMDEVERELLEAEHQADVVDIPELREKISYEVNYNFTVIVGMAKVSQRLVGEMKLPGNERIWQRVSKDVEDSRAIIRSKFLVLADVIHITATHLDHPETISDLLATKDVEELSLALKISNDLYQELNLLNTLMRQALGKKQ